MKKCVPRRELCDVQQEQANHTLYIYYSICGCDIVVYYPIFFRGESESECEKVRKKRIPAHMKITMVTAVHGPNTNCSYILCVRAVE